MPQPAKLLYNIAITEQANDANIFYMKPLSAAADFAQDVIQAPWGRTKSLREATNQKFAPSCYAEGHGISIENDAT